MSVTFRFALDDDRLARIAWTRLAEPGDDAAAALVAHLGPGGALAWVAEAVDLGVGFALAGTAEPPGSATAALTAAVARWEPRLDGLDPVADLGRIAERGGTVLIPGDGRWPAGLADLARPPFALWVLGDPDLASRTRRSVAIVGSRASTPYGEHVAADLSAGVAGRRFAVVSGGAYGIDAAAHRAALVVGGTTIAVLAGGVDRRYPAGNTALLERIEATGTLVAESPPGASPMKHRFLSRNRLIAALTGATVVVEAAYRSGALSTARHAHDLLRPVGAVPGPVTSAASAGCHGLLRGGQAICITDADELAELAGGMGEDAAPARPGHARPADGLDPATRAVLDAVPVVRPAALASVARTAGVGTTATLGALGLLALRGFVIEAEGGWRLAPRARS